MNETVILTCSICNSPKVKEMITLSDSKIMICKNCKNGFTYPKPRIPDYSSEDFQAMGGDTNYLTPFEELPKEIKRSYSTQLKMIEGKVPEGSSVLEIGGGEGIFLEMLKVRGYEVELIEPSTSAAMRARRRGLNVRNNYFQNVSFDKKFNLVCLSHVLEHIDDPLDAISRIKNILEPNGFILLAQANFKGIMPMLLKENWYAWVPEQHFTHFSLAGLKYLAKESSLSISTYKYSRLVHGSSVYHSILKYIPFLQDQIHILLRLR